MPRPTVHICGTTGTDTPVEQWALAGIGGAGDEAAAQRTLRTAGTFSKLAFKTNNAGIDHAVQFRINAADGSMTATATDGVAGVWEDAVNTDTPSIGDEVNYQTTGSAGGAFWVRSLFEADADPATIFSGGGIGISSQNFGDPVGYKSLNGPQLDEISEANTQNLIRSPGTHKHLSITVISNTLNGTANFRSRKNGANGNLLIAITASTTGLLEDTSNSDTLVSGDLVNYSMTPGGTSGTIQWTNQGSTIEWSGSQDDGFASITSSEDRAASATTHFWLPLGGWTAGLGITNEDTTKVQTGLEVTISRMRCQVTENSYTAAATVRCRKNGADANQIISITASTTGTFEDTTNTDDFEADDDWSVSITGGTSGNAKFMWVGFTMGEAEEMAVLHEMAVISRQRFIGY